MLVKVVKQGTLKSIIIQEVISILTQLVILQP